MSLAFEQEFFEDGWRNASPVEIVAFSLIADRFYARRRAEYDGTHGSSS